MASETETMADIVREMVEFGNHCAAFGGAYSPERWDNLCKRLNAAHKREIAAKDAEIAKLRECLKPIISVQLCDGGTQPISDALCAVAECKSKWRKALEGVK